MLGTHDAEVSPTTEHKELIAAATNTASELKDLIVRSVYAEARTRTYAYRIYQYHGISFASP